MNIFVALLVILLVVAYFGTTFALIVGPILWWRTTDNRETELVVMGGISVLSGIGMLLFAAAIATGGLNLSGRVADGCYHVYYVPGGKGGHTQYDPISCPGALQ